MATPGVHPDDYATRVDFAIEANSVVHILGLGILIEECSIDHSVLTVQSDWSR